MSGGVSAVQIAVAQTRLALVLLALAFGAGCATTPQVMSYFPDDSAAAEAGKVWPAPPEAPRYRFAGELRGESNFRPDEGVRPGAGERLLRWLVGLGQEREVERELLRPQTGMVDASGRILVTDAGRHAVLVFDESSGTLEVWRDTDARGEFSIPVGIAETAGGEILVADSELGRVVRLDRDGKPLGSIGKGIVQRPTGLAIDPGTGWIYVADTAAHDIKVLDGGGRLVRTIGRRGTGPGELNGPTHLAFARGKLYVSDTLNARVQVLTAQGEPVASVGRRGLYVGNLVRPKGVAVDSNDDLYIVESYHDHLLVFNAKGEFLLPIGGSGNAVGKFFLPAGVWSDARDRIFVADMFNGRVVVLQFLGG